MMVLLDGIVALGVEAVDHREARVIREVLLGTMQEIAVKEKAIARIDFHVTHTQSLTDLLYPFRVGADLSVPFHVIDAS